MKRSRACSLWVALSPLVLAALPAASAPPPATTRGTPVPTRAPAPPAFAPLPLQGPLTLEPGGKKPSVVPPKVDYDALRLALCRLVSSYPPRLSLMKSYAGQCRKHMYTVNEQQKAGCKGSDTLDQCKEKLFLHCVNTGTSAIVAKEYQESAQKLLDETPKIIELLKQVQARVKYEANYYDFD